MYKTAKKPINKEVKEKEYSNIISNVVSGKHIPVSLRPLEHKFSKRH